MKLYPVMTEKSLALSAQGIYTFHISAPLTKPTIAQTVAKTFNVTVLSVKTKTLKPQEKRFRRTVGTTKKDKVAMVRLKAGESIPGFEVSEKPQKAEQKNPQLEKKAGGK